MLTKHEKDAGRAYQRVLAQRTEGWDQFESMDAGFDGGEFSGPAWSGKWEEAADQSLQVVAERFDLEARDLEYIVAEMGHIESHEWMTNGRTK